MIGAFDAQVVVALVLASAVLIAAVRLLLHARSGLLARAHAIGLIALQCLAVALLYLVLFPPQATRPAGLMTVLTADADRRGADGIVVALPEYAGRTAESVPDLATALRRHPGTRRVEVRGTGLPWRDHDAARRVSISFPEPMPPQGLVELQLDASIAVGRRAWVRGRIAGPDAARVELRDPTAALQATATPGEDGRFVLPLTARAAGPIEFELRVLDALGETRQRFAVPFSAHTHGAPRMLVLAGAPGAELRAIRRWAVDAGVELESRVRISRDASLGATPGVEADELDNLDFLLLDLRSWRALDEGGRQQVRAAVDAGLGLLVRIDEALLDDDRASLRMLGFQVDNSDGDVSRVRLHARHAGAAGEAGPDAASPALARRPLDVHADDAAVLLADDADSPVALWRNQGRGRTALWWLDETYPLALQAEPGVHASLWSSVLGTLSRASGRPAVDLGDDAGIHQRRVLCGIESPARVLPPEGPAIDLQWDAGGCAGFWPGLAGWHALEAGGHRYDFHVGGDANRLALREANRRLASLPHAKGSVSQVPVPGSPWPWFLAFLAAAAIVWWLERRRPAEPAARSGALSRSGTPPGAPRG